MKKLITIFVWLLLSICVHAQGWEPLGTIDSFLVSPNAVAYPSMAINNLDVPFIAFADVGDTNKVHVRKYNGSTWVDVGMPGFSNKNVTFIVLTMSATGTPYVAYKDVINGNKATVQKFDGTAWTLVGTAGFSAGVVNDLSIVIDAGGTPYISYQDGGNSSKATVKKYNGTGWVDVGTPGISTGAATATRIAVTRGGTPYIIFRDGGVSNKAVVKKYDGTAWVSVGGAAVSAGSANYTAITIDSLTDMPYVVYSDLTASSKDSVKKYNGTSWVPVAGTAGPSLGAANYNSIIVAAGTPYVGCTDGNVLSVRKYDGTNWVAVGPASTNLASFLTMAVNKNNVPLVAFTDFTNAGRASVRKFDGTNWIPLYTTGIAASSANSPFVVMDTVGTPYVVYNDGANGTKLSVRKYDNANWIAVGAPGFSADASYAPASLAISKTNVPYVAYKETNNITVKKYDGSSWATVGLPGFAVGGADYITMAITANGTPYVLCQETGLSYTSLASVRKFDGTNWVQVGSPAISTGPASHTSIAMARNDTPYIIYHSQNTSYQDVGVSVKKFDGSTWVDVGTGISGASTSYCKIAIDTAGMPCIAYQERSTVDFKYQIKVKKYNGTSWIDIGAGALFPMYPSATQVNLAIGKNNIIYITYIDSNGKKAAIKKYENNAWSLVGASAVSSIEAINVSLAVNKEKIVSVYETGITSQGAGSFAKQYFFPIPCDTTSGLTVTNVIASTASINWTAVASATGYEYIIDQTAATPATAGALTTTNSYSATGLTPNTTYYIHVRTICSVRDRSAWITKQFATLPVCDTAVGLAISNITTNSADINWTAVSSAAGYEYTIDQIATAPTAPGTTVVANTYNATGLTANTTYYFHLRTDCSSNNYSSWITTPFTTNAICDTAAGLTISGITANGANINWTGVIGATNYQYTIDQLSTDPPGAGMNIGTTAYSTVALVPNTLYYFHLRTLCNSANYSPWIKQSFTTSSLGLQIIASDVFHVAAFPNPASDIISIEVGGSNGPITLKLTDVTGKTINTLHADKVEHINMNVQSLVPGIYWLKYADNLHTKVICIQKR